MFNLPKGYGCFIPLRIMSPVTAYFFLYAFKLSELVFSRKGNIKLTSKPLLVRASNCLSVCKLFAVLAGKVCYVM